MLAWHSARHQSCRTHHRVRPSVLCAHFPALYPSTQDRAWDSFGRGVEEEKGEEEGRVSAGPVGAGATKGSHSWPCPEEPPFWQEKTGKGLWESGKDRLVFKPHSPGGCHREGQAAGSPLHIARAAQNCCGSLGDRETVSNPLSSLPWDNLLSATQGTHLWPQGLC